MKETIFMLNQFHFLPLVSHPTETTLVLFISRAKMPKWLIFMLYELILCCYFTSVAIKAQK